MEKSKVITVLLSFFIPGVGHLYLGLMNRGLQFLILFFGTFFLSEILTFKLLYLLPIIWFYCLFDALHQYSKIKAGEEPIDTPLISLDKVFKSKGKISVSLIILGVYLLVEKFLLHSFGWEYTDTFNSVFFSVLLILIGAYMLIVNKIKKSKD